MHVGEVMTLEPEWLSPGALARHALQLMKLRNCRHLLVMEQGRLRGLISIQDLYAVINKQLEENVQQVEAFVYGSAYSVQPPETESPNLLERLS